MCSCKNVDFGTYTACVDIYPPRDTKTFISIDVCILEEIIWLWSKGVRTINSCCGHNKKEASILVDEKSIPIMRKLGYKKYSNPLDPKRLDGFKSMFTKKNRVLRKKS